MKKFLEVLKNDRGFAALAVIAVAITLLGAVGGVISVMIDDDVETLPIPPLSPACSATIEAGRDYVAAVNAVEEARHEHEVAGDVYDDRRAEGSGEQIEAALRTLDQTHGALQGAKTSMILTEREFLDADNRCLTELDVKKARQ